MDFSKLSPDQMKVAEMVIAAAEANGVDPNLLLAQAFRESQFSHIPSKDPKSDAFGVMQIRPSTAEENKLGDTRDLKTNINGGAKLMRQYLDKYKSPEAALIAYHQGPGVADTYIKSGGDLKAVGPKGLDYVINIGENGGFGAPTAPVESKAPSTTDPFAGYTPKARTDSGNALPALVPEESKTEKVMGAVADTGEYLATKALENPEIPAAAGVGLIKGTLEKVLQSPEKHLVDIEKGETTPEEVKAAKNKARDAQTRVGEVERVSSSRQPVDVDSLQREFDLRKFSNEIMDDDLRAAKSELKALPKNYVPPVEPAIAETAEQIAARTTPGASGAQKWVESMSDDIPTALAEKARNMRGDNPKGGQAIIDAQAAAVQRLEGMGLGDYKLDPSKTLSLPTNLTKELEGQLAAKQAQEAAEQAARAQTVEANRLAAEADLARQRQMAEQRVEQARKSKISAGERAADAKRAANTARQQVAAQAKSDAGRLETAQISARTAQQTAREAAEAQPSGLTLATREAGRRFAEKAPIIGNVLGAVGATLSTDEAVDRYRKGDYSGAVLGTIEAALNAASMAPPTSPAGLLTKGVGTVGSLGMIPVWIAHDYFGNKGPWSPKKEPQKARGGLTLMR
jgi:hypothetical protein